MAAKNFSLEVYDSLATPIWIFNLESPAIMWANSSAIKLWGAGSFDELIQRDFKSSMTQATRARLDNYRKKLKNGPAIKEQWTFYPNDEPTVVDCSFTFLRWQESVDAMVAEVVSFQTKTLNDLEKLSIEAVRHTSVAISQFSYEGELVFQNPTDLHLFGESDIFSRIGSISFKDELIPKVKGSEVFFEEIETHTKNGKRWMFTDAREVTDPLSGSKSILLEQKDITLQKQTEEELKNAEIKLVQSSKLASLGEMAGGIAHEINNPSAFIRLSAEMIEMNDFGSEEDFDEVRTYTKQIISNVDRITKTVDSLRKFARDDTEAEFEDYSLKELIDMSLDLCRSRMDAKNIDLSVGKFDFNCLLWCQPIPISQIIVNLLNNSVDAIENNIEKWIKIEFTDEPKYFKIVITDSGNGIPPDIVEKLFNPFYTTKPIGRGTGLGLSISKGIAEKHGGSLDYNSDCQNTQFLITIGKKNQIEAELKNAG